MELVGVIKMQRNNKELISICVYAVSSAIGLQDEPKEYGPLRLMELVDRIIQYCINQGDESLQEIKDKIGEKQELVMTDPEKYYESMSEVLKSLIEKRKKK